MDDEHGLTGDEFSNFDWTRWHYEGKHFEAKAVSRGEFEALLRFGDYDNSDDWLLECEEAIFLRTKANLEARGSGSWASNDEIFFRRAHDVRKPGGPRTRVASAARTKRHLSNTCRISGVFVHFWAHLFAMGGRREISNRPLFMRVLE
jgi:hypothetical protein